MLHPTEEAQTVRAKWWLTQATERIDEFLQLVNQVNFPPQSELNQQGPQYAEATEKLSAAQKAMEEAWGHLTEMFPVRRCDDDGVPF